MRAARNKLLGDVFNAEPQRSQVTYNMLNRRGQARAAEPQWRAAKPHWSDVSAQCCKEPPLQALAVALIPPIVCVTCHSCLLRLSFVRSLRRTSSIHLLWLILLKRAHTTRFVACIAPP
jgi:hypothetical protein